MSKHEGTIAAAAGDLGSPEGIEELGARQDELADQLSELSDQLDRLEDGFEDDLDDVRDRVIQVMRTAQSKADADHTHEGLERQAASTAADVEELRESLDDLESRVDGGFENYETILQRLKETADDLDDRTNQLARAIVDLRERANDLESADARRTAVEDLQTEATRHGVTAAKCGDCRTTVHVGLLARPNCPHCGSVFAGVEPAAGLLRSATLTVGERPALESGSFEPTGPGELFESEGAADE